MIEPREWAGWRARRFSSRAQTPPSLSPLPPPSLTRRHQNRSGRHGDSRRRAWKRTLRPEQEAERASQRPGELQRGHHTLLCRAGCLCRRKIRIPEHGAPISVGRRRSHQSDARDAKCKRCIDLQGIGGYGCLPALPLLPFADRCSLVGLQVYQNFLERQTPAFNSEQLEISRMMATAFFQTLLNANLTSLSALR